MFPETNQSNSTLELIDNYFRLLAQKQSSGSSRQSPKLLVIDDEKPFTDLIDQALIKEGVKIHIANDGPTALRTLEAEQRRLEEQSDSNAHRPFDLILLDLKMPQMTGVEVLKRIKERTPDVMVVICTAYPRSDDLAAALRIGFFGLIEKPLDVSKLVEIFRSANIQHRFDS